MAVRQKSVCKYLNNSSSVVHYLQTKFSGKLKIIFRDKNTVVGLFHLVLSSCSNIEFVLKSIYF